MKYVSINGAPKERWYTLRIMELMIDSTRYHLALLSQIMPNLNSMITPGWHPILLIYH